MALAMFAFIFSASAQEAELPAIDKEAAEPYLGTWYIEKMCFGADCVNLSGMGSTSTITFNSDNTLQIASEEKTDTYSWFMEDGTAYMVETIDGNTRNFPITLDENGCLLLGQDEVTVHYVHEIAPVPGTGALKEDAVFEDFAGEWVLNGMLFEKESIPASLIGVSGTLIGNSMLSVPRPIKMEKPLKKLWYLNIMPTILSLCLWKAKMDIWSLFVKRMRLPEFLSSKVSVTLFH